MGADHFIGFYGIKIALDPDDEDVHEACGLGSDARCVRARAAGLQTLMGRMTDGEDYFLFIGQPLASIGVEGDPHVSHAMPHLIALAADVDARLTKAGFSAQPALHFQLQAQY